MNYRSLALAIAALSSTHITTAAGQSVYVAPGGVYIGGGPVYVIPAPSNGNGTYVEPTYGYGYGAPEPTPYLAPTVVAPGAGYVAAAPYGLNGNGRLWLWQRPAAAALLQRRSGVERLWSGATLRSRAAAAGSNPLQRQRTLHRRPWLRYRALLLRHSLQPRNAWGARVPGERNACETPYGRKIKAVEKTYQEDTHADVHTISELDRTRNPFSQGRS